MSSPRAHDPNATGDPRGSESDDTASREAAIAEETRRRAAQHASWPSCD